MKKIEQIRAYAEGLQRKQPVLYAEKTGCILARIGKVGEEITTYVSNGTAETVNRVRPDGNGNPGIVATMADLSGNRIVDGNGCVNRIIIPRETFDRKYRDAARVSEQEQLFRPAGGAQEFVRTDEDIFFTAPWGTEQNLKAGSFLNITDPDEIYGIAYEEFMMTYTIIGEEGRKQSSDPG